MVKMMAGLPRAKAMLTTLGSRGAVMIERAPGAEAAATKVTFLGALLEALEADSGAAAAEAVWAAGGSIEEAAAAAGAGTEGAEGAGKAAAGAVGAGAGAEGAGAESSSGGGGGSDVPVPGAPITSPAVLLADAGAGAASDLGPVRVTFAPAAKLPRGDVADTTGAGDSFIGSICYSIATGRGLHSSTLSST